ncbi:thiamine-binding protein [Streptacidiphilus neutrinimicus]|uniref:thiamine-binding protein n=1 Tax=Streptacidiphilus neutrinimicus TaxID=105420 RepID=UPI0005A92529|nr:thiamine-binding protein [Streptacidiphilus neutrinimicus]
MRLKVEFTTEPFELDGFPEHARSARRVVDEAGLSVEVGPFGTTAEGEAEPTLSAIDRLVRETLAHGATRISLQVSVLEGAEDEGEGAG